MRFRPAFVFIKEARDNMAAGWREVSLVIKKQLHLDIFQSHRFVVSLGSTTLGLRAGVGGGRIPQVIVCRSSVFLGQRHRSMCRC